MKQAKVNFVLFVGIVLNIHIINIRILDRSIARNVILEHRS